MTALMKAPKMIMKKLQQEIRNLVGQKGKEMNSNIDVKGRDFGLIPFGSGRRICPGMPMGLVNVELTIANMLYSFDWEMPSGIRAEDIDTDALPGITMHKKEPLLLMAKKYNFN
ncbi:cytochrome P450 [Perilla frutescens var. hirtella]|uniref:Cytochrome P450 n=1 Tax=Perilla frutescens var. hirtella TaxID=608512 RepID=A0AAD4IVH0_PERFH|nr:cytochrome P450 [Perilla frutescens var. hirtella]